MSSKLRSALLIALGLSLAVGWFVAGPIMDKTAVGFEESAFPAGAFLQSIFAKLVPGVAASGRAYTTFLNNLRFALFKVMVNNLGRTGQVTLDEGKVIARFIN